MNYEPVGMTESPATPSPWKWLLVLPAFAFGFVVPGFLARISWEWGTSFIPSFIPGINTFMEEWARAYQGLLGGFCAVFFAAYVAPRAQLVVSIVGALLMSTWGGGLLLVTLVSGYYADVNAVRVVWESLLIFLSVVGAGGAVWYSVAGRAGEEPVGLE